MNRQNTLDVIPIDLLHEIFSRLPAKSVGRWRCVSKRFASILGSEDFKQLFLSRSLSRPLLLFALKVNQEWWSIYSSPQPQNLYVKSSLMVTKFPISRVLRFIYASGLFYLPNMCVSTTNGEEDRSHVICNPSTGQYVILPKLRTYEDSRRFLGFDPIDKQFKLLVINPEETRANNEWIGFILTLETGKMRWRTIKCPFLLLRDYTFFFFCNGICINGILYFIADGGTDIRPCVVCFDVRTETFKFRFFVNDVHGDRRLINCNGKLGLTVLRKWLNDYGLERAELFLLVLEEDVEKQKWSKYTLPITNCDGYMYVVGMTSKGEIVLWTKTKLYYFNLENKSLQSVEIQGFENHYVHVFMDHVEDLHLNDAEYFKSNSNTPLCLSNEDNAD